MEFKTFVKQFGASTRTRNLERRPYLLPGTSSLPAEFIRLCPWEAEYLFLVARRAKRGIVETGRFRGGSCFLMACASPEVPIYSIDIRPQDDDLLRKLFKQNTVGENVSLIVGDSQKTKYPSFKPFDLLFIDGDHSYDGCYSDILNWYDSLLPGGDLVFHDCYLGQPGVQDAVIDFLKTHPELQIMQAPYIGLTSWQFPAGSIAHFIKPT
jgi:predicted O-methyltransferase YrrM